MLFSSPGIIAKRVLFACTFLMLLLSSISLPQLLWVQPASAAPLPSTSINENTPLGNGDSTNGCDVGFTGWVFCMISHGLSKLTDGLFSVLQYMLHVDPISRGTPGGDSLYEIWNSFRSIANVIFIIIFLIVIWSHLTGAGISNYNIKRILPRLVVNIILVNTSYYIGVIIVDISNITGNSIKSVLDSIASSTTYHPALDGWSNITTLILGGVAGGVAIAAAIYIFAASMTPLIVSALVLILTVVLILIGRQALIIALVIISPVAFALNILPNTQKWFSKWWNALFTASMIYPIIAIVAGSGTIVANIIRAAAGDDDGMPSMIFAILGMAAEILPLITIPGLIKNSSGALSSIANTAGRISNRALSPLHSRSKIFAENTMGTRRINNMNKRGVMGMYSRRLAINKNKKKEAEQELSPGSQETGSTATDRFLAKNAKYIAERSTADIKDEAKRADQKSQIEEGLENRLVQLSVVDIDAAEVVGELQGKVLSDWKGDLSSDDQYIRAAAYRKIGKSGDEEAIEYALEESISRPDGGSLEKTMLADGIDSSGVGERSAHLGISATEKIRNNDPSILSGPGVMNRLRKDAAESGKYTPKQLTKESHTNLQHLRAIGPSLTPAAQAGLNNSIDTVKSTPKLKAQMGPRAYRSL